jgi:anaerobic selenocysteine-containing dehydrogenase
VAGTKRWTTSPRASAIAAREPEAILPYSYAGTMGLVQGEGMAARFFHRLGASQLDRTICAAAGGRGVDRADLGGKVGMKVEFFAESKLILIWGSNSIASNLHFWRQVQQAKRRGRRWSASTRAAPKRPTSATSTSRCARAPTARWRWR